MGMKNLFPSGPLEQETGLLRERWGQDGSTLLNLFELTLTADTTMHTVTAGKTAYINQIIVSVVTATAGDGLTIRDNATDKFKLQLGVGSIEETFVINFSSPLKFETSIEAVESGAISVQLTMVGWEE